MDAFEGLARITWDWVRLANRHGIRFGEETITDLVLLELKRRLPGRVRIFQTRKHEERDKGCDWEWHIIGPNGGVSMAVQAKKLDSVSGRYGALGHQVDGLRQHEVLERYAAVADAVPAYCLFNSPIAVPGKDSWHCGQPRPMEKEQLGCSIAEVADIDYAVDNWGKRTFEYLHSCKETIPWRCLIACPRMARLLGHQTATLKCDAPSGMQS